MSDDTAHAEARGGTICEQLPAAEEVKVDDRQLPTGLGFALALRIRFGAFALPFSSASSRFRVEPPAALIALVRRFECSPDTHPLQTGASAVCVCPLLRLLSLFQQEKKRKKIIKIKIKRRQYLTAPELKEITVYSTVLTLLKLLTLYRLDTIYNCTVWDVMFLRLYTW